MVSLQVTISSVRGMIICSGTLHNPSLVSSLHDMSLLELVRDWSIPLRGTGRRITKSIEQLSELTPIRPRFVAL